MRHCGSDIITIVPYISIKIMKVRAEKTDDRKSRKDRFSIIKNGKTEIVKSESENERRGKR